MFKREVCVEDLSLRIVSIEMEFQVMRRSMETKVFVQIDEGSRSRSEPGIPPQQELRQKSPFTVSLSANSSLPRTAQLE